MKERLLKKIAKENIEPILANMTTYQNTLNTAQKRLQTLEKENRELKNRLERLEKTELASAQKHIQFLEQEQSFREPTNLIDTNSTPLKKFPKPFSMTFLLLGVVVIVFLLISILLTPT